LAAVTSLGCRERFIRPTGSAAIKGGLLLFLRVKGATRKPRELDE